MVVNNPVESPESPGQNGTDNNKGKKDITTEDYIIGLGIYTFIFGLFFVLFSIFMYHQKYDSMVKLLIYVGCSGGLGGILYNFQGLTQHYIDGDFNTNYLYKYLSRPFVSIIVGVFLLFFIFGGVMTLSGVNTETIFFVNSSTNSSMSDTPNPDFTQPLITDKAMFYLAIAFLGGYSSNAFIKKMEDLAKTLFGSVDTEVKKNLEEINDNQKESKDTLKKMEEELKVYQDKISELENKIK
jgi:hypothetical protein